MGSEKRCLLCEWTGKGERGVGRRKSAECAAGKKGVVEQGGSSRRWRVSRGRVSQGSSGRDGERRKGSRLPSKEGEGVCAIVGNEEGPWRIRRLRRIKKEKGEDPPTLQPRGGKKKSSRSSSEKLNTFAKQTQVNPPRKKN